MIEKLSKKIAKVLIQEDIVKFDDYEVCIYGLQVLLITLVEFIGLIVLGILFKHITETIIFIIFFSSLRVSAGGFHSDKWYKCFAIISFFTLVSIYVVHSFTSLINMEIILLILVLSLLLLIKYSPVDTKSNPLTYREKKEQRKNSLKTFTIQAAIIISLYLLNMNSIREHIQIATLAVMMEALTLINFNNKNKGEKMNKRILNYIAKNAISVAKLSSKSTCIVFTYQPKVPAQLKK